MRQENASLREVIAEMILHVEGIEEDAARSVRRARALVEAIR